MGGNPVWKEANNYAISGSAGSEAVTFGFNVDSKVIRWVIECRNTKICGVYVIKMEIRKLKKMFIGIAIILIIVIVRLYLRTAVNDNVKQTNVISNIFTVISIIVTLISFVIPGAMEIFNNDYQIVLGEKVQQINEDNNAINGDNSTLVSGHNNQIVSINAPGGFFIFNDSDNKSDEIICGEESENEGSESYGVININLCTRNEKGIDWLPATFGDVGDTIEFQIEMFNYTNQPVGDVMARVVLPDNLEYVEDSTVLYNSNHKDGILLPGNSLCTSGINIGAYNPNANAYIRFSTIVIDKDLAQGRNILVNWSSFTVDRKVVKDSAVVAVVK